MTDYETLLLAHLLNGGSLKDAVVTREDLRRVAEALGKEMRREVLAKALYETWTAPKPGVVLFHDEGPPPAWERMRSGQRSWFELADVALRLLAEKEHLGPAQGADTSEPKATEP